MPILSRPAKRPDRNLKKIRQCVDRTVNDEILTNSATSVLSTLTGYQRSAQTDDRKFCSVLVGSFEVPFDLCQ
jgi:hypothetical protein